jgi:hypothetical protein
MFSILESVAFDTGYAGSAGLVPQSWVNGNGTSYIYYGAGEFDGQGSGDDFWGTVSFAHLRFFMLDLRFTVLVTVVQPAVRIRQQRRRWPQPHIRGLPPGVTSTIFE